jgi:hypothetical protein
VPAARLIIRDDAAVADETLAPNEIDAVGPGA